MQRSLVIQLARMGDLVQTKRLVLSLAQAGETHLLVDRSLAAFAGLIYPQAEIHAIEAHGGGPVPGIETVATLGRLQDIGFSSIYNLNYSGLNFSLAAGFPEERVRGYRMRSGQKLMDMWLSLGFRLVRERTHAPLNLVDLWAHLCEHPVPPEAVNPVARPRGGGLGVVLAGRDSRRSLPPDVLAQCVNTLASSTRASRIVLLGTRAEKPLARQLLRAMGRLHGGKVEDTVGRTGLSELMEVVGGLDRVITPDTGTMHLAAHLGVPVAATFLSSAWAWETGPYGLGHTVWQALLPCSPCVEAEPCPHGVACLEAFRRRSFLAGLAGGKGREAPENMVELATCFDSLGLSFTAVSGQDPHGADRTALRSLVAGHLGLAGKQEGPELQAAMSSKAQGLHRPVDWVLDMGRSLWE